MLNTNVEAFLNQLFTRQLYRLRWQEDTDIIEILHTQCWLLLLLKTFKNYKFYDKISEGHYVQTNYWGTCSRPPVSAPMVADDLCSS